jgi:nicotinate-nucleotide pyrophosphorylase (carboxylating)
MDIIKLALMEDVGRGDATTKALFAKPRKVRAKIIAKENGIACGTAVVKKVFIAAEKIIRGYKGKKGERIRVYGRVKDGAVVKKGQAVCIVEGDAKAILAGERTALNFLGRLSGIATLTRKYVDAVKPCKVKIMDTRKTTPGLRKLEKYAVKCGGGVNHRMGLWDQVLVKDNHIKVARSQSHQVTSITHIVERIRKKTNKKIEIEVENIGQFKEALDARPDIIMLDNMSISNIKKAVVLRNNLLITDYPCLAGRQGLPITKLEVSGGVTLANVRAVAAIDVDMISIGALTHAASSLDFSLEIM